MVQFDIDKSDKAVESLRMSDVLSGVLSDSFVAGHGVVRSWGALLIVISFGDYFVFGTGGGVFSALEFVWKRWYNIGVFHRKGIMLNMMMNQ